MLLSGIENTAAKKAYIIDKGPQAADKVEADMELAGLKKPAREEVQLCQNGTVPELVKRAVVIAADAELAQQMQTVAEHSRSLQSSISLTVWFWVLLWYQCLHVLREFCASSMRSACSAGPETLSFWRKMACNGMVQRCIVNNS